MDFPLYPHLNWISNIGFGFLGLSYISANIIFLRTFLFFGGVTLALWAFLALPSPLSTILWNSAFATINISHLCYLLYQKWGPVSLTEAESILYESTFRPSGLSKKNFKKMMKKGDWIALQDGEVLQEQGDPTQYFGVVYKGALCVIKNGIRVGLNEEDDFFGEVDMLRGEDVASVTVSGWRASRGRIQSQERQFDIVDLEHDGDQQQEHQQEGEREEEQQQQQQKEENTNSENSSTHTEDGEVNTKEANSGNDGGANLAADTNHNNTSNTNMNNDNVNDNYNNDNNNNQNKSGEHVIPIDTTARTARPAPIVGSGKEKIPMPGFEDAAAVIIRWPHRVYNKDFQKNAAIKNTLSGMMGYNLASKIYKMDHNFTKNSNRETNNVS